VGERGGTLQTHFATAHIAEFMQAIPATLVAPPAVSFHTIERTRDLSDVTELSLDPAPRRRHRGLAGRPGPARRRQLGPAFAPSAFSQVRIDRPAGVTWPSS